MDALTAANSLATIVQLLGIFRQERKDAKDLDHQKFMEWLEYHHLEEIKTLICNSTGLQAELTNLLRQDTTTILTRLDCINTTLANLLSRVEGFQGVAQILMPSADLSPQAISLLRQLVASGQRDFVYDTILSNVFLEATGVPLQISEPIFLDDDIDKLTGAGLLSEQASNSDNCRILSLTRAGARYIATLAAPATAFTTQPQ
jgi:hypothetical protein